MSSDTNTKPAKKWTHYTTEDVESALQLLCLRNGSPAQVERELGIDEKTVRYWRDTKHAERYQQIRTEVFPKLHDKITAMWEDNARTGLEKTKEAIERLDLTQVKQADLPNAIQKLTFAAGIATDKSWNGRDKPQAITETRSLAQIKADIARMAPHLVPNHAEEDAIQDANVAPPLPALS